MTTPIDHMSLRGSVDRAVRICSGAMYVGVPTTVCVPVRSLISAGVFEIPKSRILSRLEPSGRRVMKKFDGLISRWTMPIACASEMP
jgi:hypothetical protein